MMNEHAELADRLRTKLRDRGLSARSFESEHGIGRSVLGRMLGGKGGGLPSLPQMWRVAVAVDSPRVWSAALRAKFAQYGLRASRRACDNMAADTWPTEGDGDAMDDDR